MTTSKIENSAVQLASASNVRNIWGGIIINVKSYGAIGDGIQDDTIAIQKAINYAISTGQTEITMPAGTYLYGTLTDTSGLTFIGNGVTLNGGTSLTLTSLTAFKNLQAFITYPSQNILGYGRNWFDIQVPTVADFIDNVFSIQNRSNNGVNWGNAAIAFLDLAGTERGAMGYSRNQAIQPGGFVANTLYLEIGNPFTTDAQNTDLRVVNTVKAGGPYWGGAGKSYYPIEVISSTGRVTLDGGSGGGNIYLKNGTTITEDIAVGDIGGTLYRIALAMASTAARFREYGTTDQFALTTNVSNLSAPGITQDNAAKSSWKFEMGAGYDVARIARCAAGATDWANIINFLSNCVLIGQEAVSAGADGVLSVTSSIGKSPITAKSTTALPAAIFYNSLATGDNPLVDFATETAYAKRGSITYNRAGGLVAYNTTSDYRAKTVKGVVENALERVIMLKPCTGRMNDAAEDIDFFVAHELQEVVPSAVSGEKDAVDDDGNPIFQMVDKSSLIPLLTAAIQELKAIVDRQSSEIEALKKMLERG